MLKKFESLGTVLSRDEAKKIVGGGDESSGNNECVVHYGVCTETSQCCEGYTCEGTCETKFCLV